MWDFRKQEGGGNDMWEGIQDTEASTSVLKKKNKKKARRAREVPLHLKSEGEDSLESNLHLPCKDVCNGTFCLSDWGISHLQIKHSCINTQRNIFVLSNT